MMQGKRLQKQEVQPLTGAQRAAVFLLAVGEQSAAEVLKHLNPKQVQKVGQVMTTLGDITRPQIEEIVEAFLEEIQSKTGLAIGSEDYVRKVLIRALGEDKAGGLVDRILGGSSSRGMEALKWMDPRSVAEIIRVEHPQIIAIVLASLEPDRASEVLSMLPERTRADVIMRVATLESIPPTALMELDEIMERQFAGNENVKSSNLGGVKNAAEVLNFLEMALSNDIMDHIQDIDADLAQQIQDKMFVFENLIDVDNRGIQALLRDIGTDVLILALKGADDAIREKFFKNMSKRAAEMLRDDLETRGAVKLSDVEAAQKQIIAVARRMAESGEIVLGGKGEQYV